MVRLADMIVVLRASESYVKAAKGPVRPEDEVQFVAKKTGLSLRLVYEVLSAKVRQLGGPADEYDAYMKRWLAKRERRN